MVRRFARRTLVSLGHSVIEAANGQDALEMTRGNEASIDLILTDVVMPEMSGVSLAEALAQKLPGLPILFMSGYPNPRDTKSGALPRTAEFIRKPFTSDELQRRIDEVMESRSSK